MSTTYDALYNVERDNHLIKIIAGGLVVLKSADATRGSDFDRIEYLYPDADVLVYGDTVRISGGINLPGRAIRIYARMLQTDNNAAINVDGAPPLTPPNLPAPAAAGTAGIPSKNHGRPGG